MTNKKLDQLIDSWQDEIFAKLKNWIAIESVGTAPTGDNKPFGDNVRKSLDLFLSDAKAMGFDARDFDGYCGHAELKNGARTMGILGHLDIVPLGDGWTQDPLGGEIKGGKCYGRGTMDDKGPLLAALYALKAVKDLGIELSDSVRIIAGCDEETGMTDMQHYKSKVVPPDYGFSPDAEYPLINIEKGGLNLLLSAPNASDANDLKVVSMYAGERCNVVPGIATAVVEYADAYELDRQLQQIAAANEGFNLKAEQMDGALCKITATGASAHASLPEQGKNAAGMLLRALKTLGANKSISAFADKLGMSYDGSGIGIAISDELSGALTCNLGILRSDAQKIQITLDIRYPLAADEQKMCGQVAMALSDAGISLLRQGGHTPLHVPAENELVKGLLEVFHEQTGLEAKPIAIGGGTYSRTMPSMVAFGICFPGDPDTCHIADEYVYVDKYMTAIKIMAHAIVRLAGKK